MAGKFFPSCDPVGITIPLLVSMENVGGEVEWYVNGSGPNPFQIRTAESSDISVAITQNALTVDFQVGLLNVGGFAEVFVDASQADPKMLRTFQSSDASVGIVENALDIDLTVAAGGSKVFQVDSTATLLTNSDTFVTLTTLAGSAKVLDGEEWKINMCVLVCVPHGLGSTLTNAETLWLIETAAGVFTEFDRYSSRDQISIAGQEKSQPMHRTKHLTASMDTPRMRVDVRRTTVGSANFFWEDPRWGAVIIEPAP